MKYLKLFNQHSEYNTYINGSNKILPNVSLCETENEVHYNPWVETRVIATYNVTTADNTIGILYGKSSFSEMEIDGVIQPVEKSYTFTRNGQHIVKYTLTSTEISTFTFQYVSNLISIIIPNNVTAIYGYAFANCSNLTSIISLAKIAPTIHQSAFNSVKSNGTLYVPSGSTGYDVWMGTGNYYLGKYNWTKVEQ